MLKENNPASSGQKGSQNISRRAALRLLTLTATAASIETVTGFPLTRAAVNEILKTPKVAPPQVLPDHRWIYPGSLEASSGATVLLDPNKKGFVPMLEAESKVPLVAKLAKGAFDYATDYKKTTGDRPGFAKVQVHTMKHFLEEIRSPEYKIVPGTNIRTEAARYANSGATILQVSWLRMDTYQRIGIAPKDLPPGTTVSKYWWSVGGPGWELNPRLFGLQDPVKATNDPSQIDIPGIEPSRRGLERAGHVAGCAYFALKRYSLKDMADTGHQPSLALIKTIPKGVKLAIDAGWATGYITSNAEEGIVFAVGAGIGHEIKDTFTRETYSDLLGGRRPRHGLLDDKVKHDIDADIYGAYFGINFLDMAKRGTPSHRLIRMTDHPRFKNEGTDPYPGRIIRTAQ